MPKPDPPDAAIPEGLRVGPGGQGGLEAPGCVAGQVTALQPRDRPGGSSQTESLEGEDAGIAVPHASASGVY